VSNNLLGKSSISFGLKILGAACSFGFNLLLVRSLGAEATGFFFWP
jgi:hypothetical protein